MGYPGLALRVSFPASANCKRAHGCQRRHQTKAVVVGGPNADFTPGQLKAALARQVAEAQQPGSPVSAHRNWMKELALPLSDRARRKEHVAREGWAFPAPSADFTPQQLQKGPERLLKHGALAKALHQASARAGTYHGGVAPSAVYEEAQAELKARQQEARQFIQPWLDGQARRRSVQTQSQLRQRGPLMPAATEQRALQRLLAGSGSGNKDTPAIPQETAFPIATTGNNIMPDGALIPAISAEDGSLLLNMEPVSV